MRRPHFVPETTMETRQETAVLLVGTAREYGIAQRDIQSTFGGFWISDALAAVLYDEDEHDEPESEPEVIPEPEPEPAKASKKATKKTSGDRAAKTTEPTEE